MTERVTNGLVYVAGALVFASATVHLSLGIAGLLDPAVLGVGTVTLPILFLLAALLAYGLIGAYLTNRVDPRTAYSIGAALMVAYVLAYVDWHVLQVAESTLPLDAVGLEHDHSHGHDSHDSHHSHGHDDSVATVLLEHLREDPTAIVSKTAESVAALIFIVLAMLERR